MLQCEKLLSLGLAERRDALEKSGLCMFCLKHSAELECYGKGGLSKPRCTRTGCNGEHTPNVHMLMGEDNAGVNLIAGDEDREETEDENETEGEYEWEYEDGGVVGRDGRRDGSTGMDWGGFIHHRRLGLSPGRRPRRSEG
jgi:hypothetical protein